MSAPETHGMAKHAQIDNLVKEYGDWIERESTTSASGQWREITLPFLDSSNDELCFYVKHDDNGLEFSDDGFVTQALAQKGIKLNGSRGAQISRIAEKYGASISDGEIMLHGGNGAEAMNRFVQALLAIDAMVNTEPYHVSEYFVEDVARTLDSLHVLYTPKVKVYGLSQYKHTFDFLFQNRKRHTTMFCQAPNTFERRNVASIIWSWQDTREAPNRKNSEMIVIGDDRKKPLQKEALYAFESYGVEVIPFTRLPELASQMLTA